MSTFSNTPQLPQPAALSTSVASGAQSAASTTTNLATRINAGAVSTVLAATSSQLTLTTGNGKVSLPAPKLPAVLDVGKDVAVRITAEKSSPVLEIAAKYSQQRLTLDPRQSQQVLQTVTHNPASLSNSLEVKGRVVSVQQNQIQVSVNGQTVNLSVRNPQLYQAGQDIKLGVSASTLGWEATVQTGSIKESFRLPQEEFGKIINSLRPGQTIELSEKGKKLVRPVLRESSNSQLPVSLNKVSFNNSDGKLVANLDIGNTPIAKIPITHRTLEALSNVELRSNTGNTGFKDNSLQTDIKKLLGDSGNPINPARAGAGEQVARTATSNLVYKNPISNTINNLEPGTTKTPEPGGTKIPESGGKKNDVSPDIAKTIKVSQEQFADIGIKTKATTSPVINEIKLSQQKNIQQAGPSAEPLKAETKNTSNPLSNSAQQILNTLKSLNTESSGDVKQTMLQNLAKLMGSVGQTEPGASHSGQANDILKLLRQVSEQTNISGPPKNSAALNNNSLLKAVDELLGNNAIDENIKGHVKQAINQVKPEQAGLPIPDMQAVKQLLQGATLPLTPVSIVTPTPSAGLVAGLVNLLQVSLAARMNRGNQQLQDKISHSLSSIVASNVKTPNTGKPGQQNLRELSNLEQKHNMVKVLSDMVNQHSQQKLQNAERNLQGQEGMYYVLPFGTAEDQKPAELLVQRDKPEQDHDTNNTTQTKAWQLTMKLPVGELGEILTKSQVTEEIISVDLYTSSEELKNLTLNYLPLLKRRFDDLGLSLEIGRCERGNIPEQLAKNPYQILETRV